MKSQITSLLICVTGIYISFLTWGILQEQITKQTFADSQHFHYPLFMNLVQSLLCTIVGYIYLLITGSPTDESTSLFNWTLFKSLLIVAITQSLSSPLGLTSVEYVDYLLYTLAKSCKLIPVMMVSILWYGTKFPLYKYAVAGTVTLGVVAFTLCGKKKQSMNSTGTSWNTLIGLLLLGSSLFLDGLTNATQDQLFKKHKKLSGVHLMIYLNFVSLGLTFVYSTIFTSQLTGSMAFIHSHPIILKEIILYGLCGAVGQLFIFYTLAKFGSIVLITVTVTRKMISMLLSVFLFGHNLTLGQWCGLGLVFGGIGFEAWYKLNSGKQPVQEKKQK
ncbi:hypothetical protein WICPIJ_004888 [Wickerhamomyces pijperi]|uniref:UDP-galactose transporter homolog 1 n=1 Tax=Wickerhamomyces pijperi TaxID=599730 RepID=A0A9P8Q4X7_WICPI|nr:hypothetical protein WICPIJ_004888 [Wickerhamomyces pijperi]